MNLKLVTPYLVFLLAVGANGATLRGEMRAMLAHPKCEKNTCLAPPEQPKDDPLEEQIFQFAGQAALEAGQTAHPAVALGVTGIKLFTNIYNSAITSGDTKHNPLEALRKDLSELVSSSNEAQDISNQGEFIAHKLRNVKTDLADYHKYLSNNDAVKANKDLGHARETCESLHDLVNSQGTPGKNGVFWLRSRLVHANSYCNLCSYVWSISRAVEAGDRVIEEKLTQHIEDCAVTLRNFVEGAITERMNSIPKSITFTTGGESGGVSKVCHLMDWDGYYNYRATDGGKSIVSWMGKGICDIPQGPLVIFGPAAMIGTQEECPATDGGSGTLGHEADRCITRYRKGVLQGLIKTYAPIVKAAWTYWFQAKVALAFAGHIPANDLASNPLKHTGGLFGKGYMQYDELKIQKYQKGLHDVKTICHKKCMDENVCIGFGYRVNDRFDGRNHGNCWFMTGAPRQTKSAPLASNPEFSGFWVKKLPGLADPASATNFFTELAATNVAEYENLLH